MKILCVLAAAVVLSTSPGYTATDETRSIPNIAPAELARGRWALLFVVVPGCPACEQALTWFSRASEGFPKIQFALAAPALTSELAKAIPPGVQLLIDRGGGIGGSLGVKRAPTLILLVEGRPGGRLDWPFTEHELVEGLRELSEAPPAGPWRHLGNVVSLGTSSTLDGQPSNLDEVAGPFLISFFNPLCPPCWDALPGLVALGKEIRVVLVVLVPHTLSADDRRRLGESGLKAVLDADGELARRLAVRASPTYVLADRQGVIRWVHEGSVEPEELQRAVLAVRGEAGTDR